MRIYKAKRTRNAPYIIQVRDVCIIVNSDYLDTRSSAESLEDTLRNRYRLVHDFDTKVISSAIVSIFDKIWGE